VVSLGIMAAMAMTLRLTDEEQAALRETAEREHRSMQDVARDAVRQYVERHAKIRAQALARIVSEDAVLLDRLGKA
jgi:predicted transcriptional regulator